MTDMLRSRMPVFKFSRDSKGWDGRGILSDPLMAMIQGGKEGLPMMLCTQSYDHQSLLT